MTKQEMWIRLAAGALADKTLSVERTAQVADEMMDEFDSRFSCIEVADEEEEPVNG